MLLLVCMLWERVHSLAYSFSMCLDSRVLYFNGITYLLDNGII